MDACEVQDSVPVQEYNRPWPLWRECALAQIKAEKS
jgi:hypothetical protein